jgi:hypothetical protein
MNSRNSVDVITKVRGWMIGEMRVDYGRGRYLLCRCVQSGFVVDTASSTVGTGTLFTGREMTAQIRPLPEVKRLQI